MIEHLLKRLETEHGNDYAILSSRPVENENSSILIAIDPTRELLTYKRELSDAVTIGAYQTTYLLIESLQNENLEVGYISLKNKTKSLSYIKLSRDIKKIILDLQSAA